MPYRTRYLMLSLLVPMLFPLSCGDSAKNGTDGPRPANDAAGDAPIDAAADGRADAGVDAASDGKAGPGDDAAADGAADGPPPGSIFAPITPLSGLPLKLK